MATSPTRSDEPMLASESRGWRWPLALAAGFACLTYALVSSRAVLNPDHSYPLWSLARLVSVLFGALLFLIAIRLVDKWRRLPPRDLAMRAIALVPPVALAMLAARLLVDFVSEGDPFVALNIRWVLAWMGYFMTSLAAAVAFELYTHLERAEAGSAPDAGTEDMLAPDEGIWVQRQSGAVRIPLAAIDWIEAEGNYVRIHGGDASGLIRTPLSAMEDRLSQHGFIRVHRSALCRASAIRAVTRRPTGALQAELESGAHVPVGRSFASRIKALIEAH